ncbi:hypothetical protein ASG67_07935 [Sphingomonas sp. Leaf339]|uniref:glycosyltransferase n=1 Tax=Sphingomonas sp. Leaf339 TaxID=1736343 RepID=UPI0006F3C435|nr:glycosyltransferase [Sphingomonas sp. Leaf339]KQU55998.1 hypothetical protein ASG67_07935 [Sphingomonas sp. Leaf339]
MSDGPSAPGSARRPKVHVHLSYGQSVARFAELFAEGQQPERTPYGFHHAEECGFDVSFSEDDKRDGGRKIARWTLRRFSLDVPHAFFNRRRMAAADIIWTMSEWDAMSARLLMELGIVPKRPIIGTAIWVFDWWDGLSAHRRFVYEPLLKRLDLLLTHTQACLNKARATLPAVRTKLMHFGIATDTFQPVPEDVAGRRVIRIVAAGNDMTRDWQVLLDAFGNDPDYELVIINRELSDDLLAKYTNLTIPREPPMPEFRRLYAGATYIAIPMRDNIYSGTTVALEAMAMGVPVISTRAGGSPTYLNDDEALFVPPGDAAAWRAAAKSQTPDERQAMARRANARFLRDDYSTLGMMRRYTEFSAPLIGRRAKDGRIDD